MLTELHIYVKIYILKPKSDAVDIKLIKYAYLHVTSIIPGEKHFI